MRTYLLAALLLIGCESPAMQVQGDGATPEDLAGPAVDFAQAPPDLTTVPDMAGPTGGTGQPCRADGTCDPWNMCLEVTTGGIKECFACGSSGVICCPAPTQCAGGLTCTPQQNNPSVCR